MTRDSLKSLNFKEKKLIFWGQKTENYYMTTRLLAYFLLVGIFLLSCATETTESESQETSMIYASTGEQNYFMSCQFFADTSFRAYIYNSDQEGCVYLEITESPPALLERNDLFIQIYPFTSTNQELKYGSSVPIYILQKSDSAESLMKSFIIDSHIIKVDLKQDSHRFFEDHKLAVCNLEEQWEALQIVIYERRSYQDSLPIRTSKMLIPPFLVHPEYFKEQNGELLAPYHPFFDLIPQYQSDPQAYYDRAEEMCYRF